MGAFTEQEVRDLVTHERVPGFSVHVAAFF
jgi:hypothetical protein